MIGAAAGAIGDAAGEGAGYGGIYGAVNSGMNAEHEKRIVFVRCLEGRGYRVLNAYPPSYAGWPSGNPVSGPVVGAGGSL